MSEETNKLEIMRHSCAHVVAAAAMELYPGTKLGVGPIVEYGFYYDFDFPEPIGEEDLEKIEKRACEIINDDRKFTRDEMPIDEAIKFFENNHQTYKVELLKDLKERGTTKMNEDELQDVGGSVDSVSVYHTGDFVDLCRGPHVHSAKEIGPFKLNKLAGAYWRGNENSPQLQRIYGVCFETQEDLDKHLEMLEEAKKRDHRKLGKELDLFTFSDLVGPGLPLWTPNGTIIADEIEKLARETEAEGGYLRVRTPHIAKGELYKKTGHLSHYKEDMFPPMELDNEEYYLKPMNCPHHHQIYASRPRSYKDLPMRLAEYGHCYRYEDSGVLFGLMRVRSLSMNDAHIYCTEEQFEDEFNAVIEMYMNYFEIFGIDKYLMRLSLHSPDGLGKKYVDNEELWIKTENMIRNAMKKTGCEFVEAGDEAAFYGPKIDVEVWSAIGKQFTLATNQVDFDIPAKMGLVYTDKDGKEKVPLCIHRAPLSTHERMIGFLIEHYAGAFPVWLSPVQVVLASVGEAHKEYAQECAKVLRKKDIRIEVDDSDETVGKKIRNAELKKIPYVVVLGDKEKDGGEWQVRVRGEKEQKKISEEGFVKMVREKIGRKDIITSF